jgi:ATP-dependent protease ClpP protease subunit
MSKTASIVFLAILGILVSTSIMSKSPSKSNEVITLTSSNYVLFSGEVNDKSVAEAQIQLGKISKNLDKDDTIYLILDTPGGSIGAGNLFIDYAKSLPQNIKPICIFCASMGYHFFQSFGERIVYSSSTVMSHRARAGGLAGQVPGELNVRLAALMEELDRMDTVASNRVGLSLSDYKRLIHDELWLSGTAAVKTKHADRVAKIKCDDSIIDQTRTEVIDVPIFGTVELLFSKCPLISGMLSYRLDKSKNFTAKEIAEVMVEIKKVKRTVKLEY